MKVCLINPGKSQRFSVHEPLNLGFLASYLEARNIEVALVDELAGQDVDKELGRFKPDMVGITATTTLVPEAYAIADRCRAKGLLTVMGGVHATLFPDEALRHADVVVRNEGELGLMEVIEKRITSGVVDAGYIRDLDQVPKPARHLMQMDFYLRSKDRIPYIIYYAFVPVGMRIASLLTSRGCPYSCIYCHNTWRGTPVRYHSAEWVVDEIEELKGRYGIQAAYFVEDNFFLHKKRAQDICCMLIRKKIKLVWGASTRVDNLDEETLRIAKEAGCKLVNFGFESGSQRVLDALKKGTTVEQARKAIALCNAAGVMANGSFMLGNPGETMEDLALTREFVKKNRITWPAFYITTPYPGTGLWDIAKEKNLLPAEPDWASFAQERVIAQFSRVPKEVIEQLRAGWYLDYFLHNKREALRFGLMALRYPRASFEKVGITLAPLLRRLSKIFS